MPLERGIDSFCDALSGFPPDDTVLTAFFDAREPILNAFRENPQRQLTPYEFSSLPTSSVGKASYSIPADLPIKNPIFQALCATDLVRFGPQLADLSGWLDIARGARTLKAKKEYANSYALIDMACYLVYLLNIYTPNKSLIQNLVSTHMKVDALGRENSLAAEAAIEKLIRKSVHSPSYSWLGDQAAAVLIIAKHDASDNGQPRIAGRGIDFERDCEARLLAGGFEVQTTPASGDYGADLIAMKHELGFAIQCKDTSKPVGVKAVQEAVAARSHYKADFSVVCASAGFTDAAIELASSNKTILCNADQLVRRLDAI
jgi:Holliday junction resolvase